MKHSILLPPLDAARSTECETFTPLVCLRMRQALKESPQQRSSIKVGASLVAAGAPLPALWHWNVLCRPHQELPSCIGTKITLGAALLIAQSLQNGFQKDDGLSRFPTPHTCLWLVHTYGCAI